MKKFLLIVVAAFAAANVSAANGVKKANFPKAQKKAMVAADAHLGILSKSVNAAALQSANVAAIDPANLVAAAKKNAPDVSELIPCYSEITYFPIEGLGFFKRYMYDQASYLVQDGKAYLKPFADLGMIEGVVETGVKNMFSELGADSITFNCEASFVSLKSGENVYLAPADYDTASKSLVRSNTKTFGAYYIPEIGELYIPIDWALALFVESETSIYSPRYVFCEVDLMPQAAYNEVTSKAIITGTDLYDGETKYTNPNGLVVFAEDGLYIKGCDLDFRQTSWAYFTMDESDESIYVLPQQQYLQYGEFGSDGVNYFPGVATTVGMLHDNEGKVSAFANEYASIYRWTDNADETSTLASTNSTGFGEYIFMAASQGMFGAFTLNVNITYESIVGIKEVKGNKQQNDAIYNIAGQRVAKDYKGLVIKNGKKYLVK